MNTEEKKKIMQRTFAKAQKFRAVDIVIQRFESFSTYLQHVKLYGQMDGEYMFH